MPMVRSTRTFGLRLLRSKLQSDQEEVATRVSPPHPEFLEPRNSFFADGDDQSIPFNTQFFHDDYDDGDGPGFDDGDDGGGVGSAAPGADGDEPDLMTTLAGTSRRVRPQYVNYTKKAKRVDVRKLKENIWKSLDINVPKLKDPDESMVRILVSISPPP